MKPSPSPSPTDYADVMVAAIEGGIGYWSETSHYIYSFADLRSGGDPSTDYVTAIIIDLEDDNATPVDSRSAAWHNAVTKAAMHFGVSVEDFIEDHDAGYADVAMQFLVHGEVIYG